MIVPTEIIKNDIVKVLVNEDGIEDQMYGVVGMNTGNNLGLKYLSPTDLIYKSACVYKLDDEELLPAPYESIMEHFMSGTTFEDLEMKSLGMNRFAFYSEIDIEDSDSEIYDEDGDDESDLDGFIVSDSEIVGQDIPLPPDHESIDKEWNEWEPTTSGGKSFKETINSIETRVRRLSE
jgi:hypothetical protein